MMYYGAKQAGVLAELEREKVLIPAIGSGAEFVQVGGITKKMFLKAELAENILTRTEARAKRNTERNTPIIWHAKKLPDGNPPE